MHEVWRVVRVRRLEVYTTKTETLQTDAAFRVGVPKNGRMGDRSYETKSDVGGITLTRKNRLLIFHGRPSERRAREVIEKRPRPRIYKI